VAGNGRGEPDHVEPVHRNEAEHTKPDQGHEAPDTGIQETPDREKVERKTEGSARLQVFITARRVRIDPEKKRAQYIERLENLIEKLDKMASTRQVPRKTKLRAMEIMAKVINICYGIVRDVEVEMLEREFEELEKASQQEEDKTNLYEIEEATS